MAQLKSTQELMKIQMRSTQNIQSINGRALFGGVSDQYITLDTFLKSETDSNHEIGRFSWNLNSGGLTSEDALGIKEDLVNIIEMQVNSFFIPDLPNISAPAYVSGVPSAPVPNNIYPTDHGESANSMEMPQLPNNSRLTMHVEQSSRIAFNDLNGKFHNFEFVVASNNATPVNNNFIFTDPIQKINNITLRFNSPDNSVVFDPDVFINAPVSIVSNYLNISVSGHGLSTLDRIYLVNCTCSDATVKSYLTRASGFPVLKVDDDNFSILPDLYIVSHTAFPFSIDVRIAKRRMRIQMRIRGLTERVTNQKIA